MFQIKTKTVSRYIKSEKKLKALKATYDETKNKDAVVESVKIENSDQTDENKSSKQSTTSIGDPVSILTGKTVSIKKLSKGSSKKKVTILSLNFRFLSQTILS